MRCSYFLNCSDTAVKLTTIHEYMANLAAHKIKAYVF